MSDEHSRRRMPAPPSHELRLPRLEPGEWVVVFVRYLLPALIALAGLLVLALGHGDVRFEGGASLLGAAGSVALVNWLYHRAVDVDERDAEEAAREFFSEHGYWPDEGPRPWPSSRQGSGSGPPSGD
jgi:hypothetical protein